MHLRLRHVLVASAVLASAYAQADVHFKITYDAAAFKGPFTGKVILYLSQSMPEPRKGPDWSNPGPEFSADFKNVKPGRAIVIDSTNAVSYPAPPSKIAKGDYNIQAVFDRNLGGRQPGSSPGNIYSKVAKVSIDPTTDSTIDIACDQVVKEPAFKETPFMKLVKFPSKLLSKFYHRTTYMYADVWLPKDWAAKPKEKFPVDYEVPGFGGTYTNASGVNEPFPGGNGTSFIGVYLDPNCPTGHTVFADSANNGPWGKALTTELIPYVEKKYRGVGKAGARFVGGHSSGGWSSLWLQITYPDFFDGVFSTSPDPVDFHAFQLIDLYAPHANLYYDSAGQKIKVARLGGDKFLYTKDFVDMEAPIRGEQFGSFNAVFGPRGADGQPVSICDPATGAIRPRVLDNWKKYDIALILRKNWKTLGPKLKGKLHVWCGSEDTFYLDNPLRLFMKEMKDLHSDAEIALVPGDHFTMETKKLQDHMDQEMADAYLAWKKKQGKG